MIGSRGGPKRDTRAREARCERSNPLPSCRAASATPAALASAPLCGVCEAADEGITACQRPEEPVGPVLARLADPEHFDKEIPVRVSVQKRGGEQMLCLHILRPGAQLTEAASLRLSALSLSRFWECPSSTRRIIELKVPGQEDRVGSVYLKLDSYECMTRLVNMIGLKDFE